MNQEKKNELNRDQMLDLLLGAQDGDVFPLLVTGMSMTPFLYNRRSVVYLEKNSQYRPAKLDIVFFMRLDQMPVLHRVIGIKENGNLVIKGDAQRWREEIRPEQVLARVTYIKRKKRKFSVDNGFYRCMVRLWMPFRWLHPPVSRALYLCSRIPNKLARVFRKKRV
jgi:hypothetical protein